MFSRPAVALFAVAAADLFVAMRVADAIGAGATLFALVVLSGVGIVLLRHGGVAFFESTARQLSETPDDHTSVVADRAMVGLAALLLVVPGFVTAAVGALLFVPAIRALVRPKVLQRVQPWAHANLQFGRMRGYGRNVVDVDVVDVPSRGDSEPPSRPELS